VAFAACEKADGVVNASSVIAAVKKAMLVDRESLILELRVVISWERLLKEQNRHALLFLSSNLF
jgi:hypothetical protein